MANPPNTLSFPSVLLSMILYDTEYVFSRLRSSACFSSLPIYSRGPEWDLEKVLLLCKRSSEQLNHYAINILLVTTLYHTTMWTSENEKNLTESHPDAVHILITVSSISFYVTHLLHFTSCSVTDFFYLQPGRVVSSSSGFSDTSGSTDNHH